MTLGGSRRTLGVADVVEHDPREPRASARAADDHEASRLRALLLWLRPDLVDPSSPPPRETATPRAPVPRDPTASWGGIPAGAFRGSDDRCRRHEAHTLGDVRQRLAELESEGGDSALASRVLWRLRETARESDGVRGVSVELALWAVGDALPGDLGARRAAAYVRGRALLWGAAAVVGL